MKTDNQTMGGQSGENPRINEIALAYMEEKYGEVFTYAGPTGDSLSGTHALLVRCDSLPEAVIVQVENYRQEDKVFLDNFLAVKYKQETINFLQGHADTVLGEANVFYEPRRLGSDLPADTDFTGFLASEQIPLLFNVEMKASSFRDRSQMEAMAEAVAQECTRFQLLIVVLEDDDYGTMDWRGIGDLITQGKFVQCVEFRNLGEGLEAFWSEKE